MGAGNCADGCGRPGCKGVARNGWGEEVAGDERAWLRGRLRTANGSGRIARTAADGLGAREWLEMGGEKKPLEISELGWGDGCGREMGAGNCADGCGRRGCKGVARNGWGEEVAGDERAWLRGRLRTANGSGRMARFAVESHKLYCNGCKQVFLHFGADDFPLNISFEKCFKIVVFPLGRRVAICV